MREIRLSGSEGGGTEYNPFSYPCQQTDPLPPHRLITQLQVHVVKYLSFLL